jgi:RNA polymerase sigma-70 factor (ECF subfamily)
MNIDEVLERIQAGDRQAFAAIVTRFQGPLFGYLGRMGCGAAEAEELAQDTFLRAWSELPTFDARRGAFSTWLFTIARNLAINELGRARGGRAAAEPSTVERVCEAPQPQERIALDQRRAQLRAALMALPVVDRNVLALAYIEELAIADIARIEGCSAGSVKVRLHRARKKLSTILGEEVE